MPETHESQITNHVVVSSEALYPIVRKHLNSLTAEQWLEISEGTFKNTDSTLISMFSEITDAVREAVKPRVVEHVESNTARKNVPPEQTALQTFSVEIKDSIPHIFANYFQLEDEYDVYSAEEDLEYLLDFYLSRDLNCYMTTLDRKLSPHLAIYFPGVTSNKQLLNRMGFHAIRCLQKLIKRHRSKEPEGITSQISEGEIPEPELERGEYPLNVTSWIFEEEILELQPEKCESPLDITAQISDGEILEPEPERAESPLEVTDEIFEEQIQEPEPERGESPLEVTGEIFEEQIQEPEPERGESPLEVTSHISVRTSLRADSFAEFAKEKFGELVADLKTALQRKDSRTSPERDDNAENLLPGSVSETPGSESQQSSSPFDFEIVRADVDGLFNELNLPDQANKAPEDIMSSGTIRKFAKELTDKLHHHLRTGETDHVSVSVLYTMAEDAVGRFLQQVLSWMETDPSNRTSQEVSAALMDIKEEIAAVPEENKDIKPKSSDSSHRQRTTPPPVAEQSQKSGSEKSSLGILGVPVDRSSPLPERTIKNLIAALVMRIITKAPVKMMKTLRTADLSSVIKRLSNKALEEIKLPRSAVQRTTDKMKRLSRAIVKDLQKEFGAPEQLLKAVLASDNPSFDDAVVKRVKIHLDALLSPPKPSAVARFFSAVGRAMSMPFRWCIMGHCDD